MVPDISARGFTALHSDRVLCSTVQWHDIVKIQIQQAMSCDYLNRFIANANSNTVVYIEEAPAGIRLSPIIFTYNVESISI
jgi:hypothetical protein